MAAALASGAVGPAQPAAAAGGSRQSTPYSSGSGVAAAGAGSKRPTTPNTTVPAPLPSAQPHQPLTVLDQSPYVQGPTATWSIALRLPAGAQPGAHLAITMYQRLYTRTDFQLTLTGKMSGFPIYQSGSIPVSKLTAVPSGGVDLPLPINPSPGQKSPGPVAPVSLQTSSFGVYPLQIGMVNSNGVTIGTPITTYIVWVPRPVSFPKLDVSWLLPVQATPSSSSAGYPARLDSSQVNSINGLASALYQHQEVPVSLEASPQTLAALSASGAAGRSALSTLSELAGGHSAQVLPSGYVPIDIGALTAAGLGAEVNAQLATGASTLRSLLHSQPSAGTWAVNGPLYPASAVQLEAQGAKRFVVPKDDLNSVAYNFTFAQPVLLAGSSSKKVEAVAADTALDVHFTNTGDQVLQGEQLLAELSMIDSETPGQTRGVAILTPGNWSPNSSFLDAVLGGLQGNPLLQAVTADQLFSQVPLATTKGSPMVRELSFQRADPVADAAALRTARQHLVSFSSTFPGATQQASVLDHQLLAAESSDLSVPQRAAALSAFAHALQGDLAKVSVPPGVSITLTARNGNIPVTVLDKASAPARIRLQLSSQKLNFRSFQPPGGTCRATNPTSVVCSLSLTSPATTLKVPVETRTTGVFSLLLTVESADGTLVVNQARYTVRSTAVSFVAVVLMIGAVILLAVWWIRDRRHGRRARRLVQPPEDESSSPPVPGGRARPAGGRQVNGNGDSNANGNGDGYGNGHGDRHPAPDERPFAMDDPVIAEFFASPPPDYSREAAQGRPGGRKQR